MTSREFYYSSNIISLHIQNTKNTFCDGLKFLNTFLEAVKFVSINDLNSIITNVCIV
jgi:hypothetical protein